MTSPGTDTDGDEPTDRESIEPETEPEAGAYDQVIGTEGGAAIDPEGYRLLVPVIENNPVEAVERIVQAAALIADDRDGDLLVLCLVGVPKQTPYEALDEDHPIVREGHENAERLLDIASATGVPARGVVCLARNNRSAILSITERYACDGVFMIVEPGRSQRRRLLSGETIETIVSRADTDVFVGKPGERDDPPKSVLLPVSGGPHSGLATEVARAVALATGARIDVVHFTDETPTAQQREEADEVFDAATAVLDGIEGVETELVSTDSIPAEIVSRSDRYDMTVLGAPTMGLLRQFIFGSVPDSVTQRTENAVLMAKQRTGTTSAYYRWIAGEPGE
jgi:nucleotide-binding universal stress UspA family protein